MSVLGLPKRCSIDVLIRLRPMRAELQEVKAAWDTGANTLREKGNPDNFFTFDHVYDTDTSTRDLYERSVRSSIVANVAKGYNGTVFAYGQTGSGKSYTMLGATEGSNIIGSGNSTSSSGSGSSMNGIVALSVRDLFLNLEREQQQNLSLKVSVYVTIIEIYNEQLRDLLLATGAVTPPLSIRENEHGVYVHNAIKREVKSAHECIQLIYTQAASRVSASTAMNEISSRSHCVICIKVEKSIPVEKFNDTISWSEEEEENDETEESVMKRKIVATLNLVDLAGSERVAKTGLAGLRRVEGGHINKSLTILTTVIVRLSEANNNNSKGLLTPTFVPYRDSRLTHLLKTAIGGNSLTAVLCCITPAIQHVNESRSTLQFAARAKAIKNQVLVNEVISPKAKIRELEVRLRQYKRMMMAMTIYLWSKNLRIKNLQTKLTELNYSGISNVSMFTPSGNISSIHSGNGGGILSVTPNDQHRLIIERLTREKEGLQKELNEVQNALRRPSVSLQGTYKGRNVATIDLADDEEKRQLRADVRDLEHMLKEALDEKSAIQKSMDELDNLCKELEDENATHVSTNNKLQATCKELQALIDVKENTEIATKNEVNLLRQQLSKTQSDMLEKGRGDEYLHQLTKLHIEHQELQYAHHQLQEKYNREIGEEGAKMEEMRAKMEELEDEVAELRDANRLQNSYLWRLLSVASVVSRGKAVVPENTTTTVVHGAQVDDAIRTLTSFVMTSLEKPISVQHSTEVSHNTALRKGNKQQEEEEEEEEEDRVGTDTAQKRTRKGDVTLLKRIEELQRQLFEKDAHRDVIVDSKLKRMQSLALRLHTTNTALMQELRQSCALGEELFRIVEKHSTLMPKLTKAGITPISFKSAIERVMQAKVPSRPYGHN